MPVSEVVIGAQDEEKKEKDKEKEEEEEQKQTVYMHNGDLLFFLEESDTCMYSEWHPWLHNADGKCMHMVRSIVK